MYVLLSHQINRQMNTLRLFKQQNNALTWKKVGLKNRQLRHHLKGTTIINHTDNTQI